MQEVEGDIFSLFLLPFPALYAHLAHSHPKKIVFTFLPLQIYSLCPFSVKPCNVRRKNSQIVKSYIKDPDDGI